MHGIQNRVLDRIRKVFYVGIYRHKILLRDSLKTGIRCEKLLTVFSQVYFEVLEGLVNILEGFCTGMQDTGHKNHRASFNRV
jgi:hypothetical protein